MQEAHYITKYVAFLKQKKILRENLREDLAKLELEFLEVQTNAISCGIEVRAVQKAVNELKKQQEHNKRLCNEDDVKMRKVLADFAADSTKIRDA